MLEPLVVSLYPKYLLNHTHTHTQQQTLKLEHRAYLSTEHTHIDIRTQQAQGIGVKKLVV